jgi:dolichol-phosphate mannosyltransferase
MKIPVISVIAPIYNESANLPELYRRVSETLDLSGDPWELVLVDDGSPPVPGADRAAGAAG